MDEMNADCARGGARATLLYLSAALCVLLLSTVRAAYAAEITLVEAVETALQSNLTLKHSELAIPLAEAGLLAAGGEFDPVLRAEAGEAVMKGVPVSALTGSDERLMFGEFALGGKFTTGTGYELVWRSNRLRSDLGFLTLNPYYSSELTLTVTQPLLKGRGRDVQRASISVAANGLDISRLMHDDAVMDVVSGVAGAYWELYYARDGLGVSFLSLKLARSLLAEVEARIEAGVMPPVERHKAESEVATRQKELLYAEKNVADAEDALRALMGVSIGPGGPGGAGGAGEGKSLWEMELVPTDEPPAGAEMQSLEGAVAKALAYRNDLKEALLEVDSKRILGNYYKNQQSPALDLVASVGLNGIDGDFTGSFEELGSGDNYSWKVGVAYTMPLGNRAARGAYLKARHDEQAAVVAARELKRDITLEVRKAWRARAVAAESIASAQKARVAAEKALRAEEERFRVGMATLNDVLKAQNGYATALSAEKRAHVDLAISEVVLQRAKGTLMEDLFKGG